MTPTAGGQLKLVNGRTTKNLKLVRTGANNWQRAVTTVKLNAGKNTIKINNTAGIDMYIDQVSYTPEELEDEKYLVTIREAANGTIVSDKEEAFEGDTVRLTVNAAEGYALKQLRVVNSVFFTMEKTIDVKEGETEIKFVMPCDNVTIEPTFVDATSVCALNFTTVNSGEIPMGWRCTQENNEVHEYPNQYTGGARTFAGFTGHQGKALYWREKTCEYGVQSAYPLTLAVGDYKLTYAMAAWKGTPKYKVQVVNVNTGKPIAASDTYTAAPNANGSSSANVSSAINRVLEFTVEDEGNYIIRFTNESNSAAGYDEYLLLECRLNIIPNSTEIKVVNANGTESYTIYDLSGRKQTAPAKGINIIRTADGKTRKVFRK
jgi:hypothetical protein